MNVIITNKINIFVHKEFTHIFYVIFSDRTFKFMKFFSFSIKNSTMKYIFEYLNIIYICWFILNFHTFLIWLLAEQDSNL